MSWAAVSQTEPVPTTRFPGRIPRHCERSEAIQLLELQSWIASSLRSSQ
jgi:hypothetical protein